jgi:phosphoserine phosphatase
VSGTGKDWSARVETAEPALCVDLDGTLTACDTLHHLLGELVRTRPWQCVDLPLHVVAGRARLKERVSDRIGIRADRLPYHPGVLEYLREQHGAGRRLVLATAADHRIADAVAAYLGIFETILATRGGTNLRGARKRDAIRSEIGPDFDYLGDSWADLPVFEAARYSLLVAPSPRLRAAAFRNCRVLRVFDPAAR